MLGRKQNIKNEAWLEAVRTIGDTVSRTEIDKLAKQTIADIKKAVKGKKAAYAWSAGKDSIVLGKLCEAAGLIIPLSACVTSNIRRSCNG